MSGTSVEVALTIPMLASHAYNDIVGISNQGFSCFTSTRSTKVFVHAAMEKRIFDHIVNSEIYDWFYEQTKLHFGGFLPTPADDFDFLNKVCEGFEIVSGMDVRNNAGHVKVRFNFNHPTMDLVKYAVLFKLRFGGSI